MNIIFLKKCDWYGKELVKINRFYSSSEICNPCSWINQNLKLSDRKWACKCGEKQDRDLNVSKKYMVRDLPLQRWREKSDFSNKTYSMRSEKH